MSRYKIVVIGNGTLAARGLSVLAPIADIPLIVADSNDSGRDTWRESFVKAAVADGYVLGETLLQPRNPNANTVLERIKEIKPDIILSLQCRHIIRSGLYSIPKIGTFNLHNAPLPLLRGCDPFAWAIHDGLKQMGVTLHQILDEGVDNGPILSQLHWPIEDYTSAWDLYQEALIKAVALLKGTFSTSLLEPASQKDDLSTYHPMGQFDYSDRVVDWNLVADTLSAWVRARIFPPIQLPRFYFGESLFAEILTCRKVSSTLKVPGLVESISPLIISAKWGALELITVKFNGVELGGSDFARQFGFKIGQSLD